MISSHVMSINKSSHHDNVTLKFRYAIPCIKHVELQVIQERKLQAVFAFPALCGKRVADLHDLRLVLVWQAVFTFDGLLQKRRPTFLLFSKTINSKNNEESRME